MITIKNVYAGYGEEPVLQGVSFSVETNKSLSIVGPNGCGKTTLLRAIAGLLPYSGEILLDNVTIRKMKPFELAKKIAMLSQTTQLYFNYTVWDTVMMGRYVHQSGSFFAVSKQDKIVVTEVLSQVGMLEMKDHEVDKLSGGQLQRVFLAKILAQDPEIILLDEPTNHLDISFQVELIEFLNTWSKSRGKTIIGVLHDFNLSMLLSDNVLLMENGSIKALGKSTDVFSSDVLNSAYKMDIGAFMLNSLRKWEIISAIPRLSGTDG